MRIRPLLLFVLTATAGIVATAALASGSAAPGKEFVQLTCDGLGTITVSVQRARTPTGGPDRGRAGSRHPGRSHAHAHRPDDRDRPR
jgi:hypothetical protein